MPKQAKKKAPKKQVTTKPAVQTPSSTVPSLGELQKRGLITIAVIDEDLIEVHQQMFSPFTGEKSNIVVNKHSRKDLLHRVRENKRYMNKSNPFGTMLENQKTVITELKKSTFMQRDPRKRQALTEALDMAKNKYSEYTEQHDKYHNKTAVHKRFHDEAIELLKVLGMSDAEIEAELDNVAQ